jgi:hypothetical protein
MCALPFIHAMFNIFFLAGNICYNVKQIREANQSPWIILLAVLTNPWSKRFTMEIIVHIYGATITLGIWQHQEMGKGLVSTEMICNVDWYSKTFEKCKIKHLLMDDVPLTKNIEGRFS